MAKKSNSKPSNGASQSQQRKAAKTAAAQGAKPTEKQPSAAEAGASAGNASDPRKTDASGDEDDEGSDNEAASPSKLPAFGPNLPQEGQGHYLAAPRDDRSTLFANLSFTAATRVQRCTSAAGAPGEALWSPAATDRFARRSGEREVDATAQCGSDAMDGTTKCARHIAHHAIENALVIKGVQQSAEHKNPESGPHPDLPPGTQCGCGASIDCCGKEMPAGCAAVRCTRCQRPFIISGGDENVGCHIPEGSVGFKLKDHAEGDSGLAGIALASYHAALMLRNCRRRICRLLSNEKVANSLAVSHRRLA